MINRQKVRANRPINCGPCAMQGVITKATLNKGWLWFCEDHFQD